MTFDYRRKVTKQSIWKTTSNRLRLKGPFTWKHHWFGGLLCILGVLLLFQCCQHSPQIQLYWSLALLSTFKIILKSSKIVSLFIMIHFTTCAFHLITKNHIKIKWNRFRDCKNLKEKNPSNPHILCYYHRGSFLPLFSEHWVTLSHLQLSTSPLYQCTSTDKKPTLV